MCIVFFFKQKTAYEMRISDWSSDVCSSDLQPDPEQGFAWLPAQARRQFAHRSDRQSRTVAQYVYSIALPVPTFTAYVRQQLRAEGWEAEPFMAGLPAHNAWRREARSEEHTSELQSLMRISYAVFCLKKKKKKP